MRTDIVKAGHRYYGLAYLILAEDGRDPANNDPDLPPGVLRITMISGRRIELTGTPADDMRRALEERSEPVERGVQGQHVPSPGRTVRVPGRRRGRKAE